MKKWIDFYNEIQEIGDHLKHTRAAFIHIPFDERRGLEGQRDELAQECGYYLTGIGLAMPPPTWIHDADDERTWASSPNFIYNHLRK